MQNVLFLDTENVVSKKDKGRIVYEIAIIIGNLDGVEWEECFSFPIPTPYVEFEYVPYKRLNTVGYVVNAQDVRKVEDVILEKILEHDVFKGYAYNASFDREALLGFGMDYLANGIEWHDMLQAVRRRWDISRKNIFRETQATWSKNGTVKSSNLGHIVERLTEIRAIEARPNHSALADTKALFGLWQDFKVCHKKTDFPIF